MKKAIILFPIIYILFLIPVVSVSAANGDIIDKIYSTDILAYVNGQSAQSYNIGGKTVVIAEYLSENQYGFYANYNDENRILTISNTNYSPQNRSVERGMVGKILGNVYETDIKVIFNGQQVKGYNIGGQTAVCIEDLGALGDSPNAAYGFSKYLCNAAWDAEARTIALHSLSEDFYKVAGDTVPCYSYIARNNNIFAKFDPMKGYWSSFYLESENEDNFTEEFLSSKYLIKPFYIVINDKSYESGLCYVYDQGETTMIAYCLKDIEKTKELLLSERPAKKSYEEAMSYLKTLSGYTVTQQLDNENYSVLTLTNSNGGKLITAVKQTGGYILLQDCTSDSDKTITISLEHNNVNFQIYPFGGPHGEVTTLHMTFELDMHLFY